MCACPFFYLGMAQLLLMTPKDNGKWQMKGGGEQVRGFRRPHPSPSPSPFLPLSLSPHRCHSIWAVVSVIMASTSLGSFSSPFPLLYSTDSIQLWNTNIEYRIEYNKRKRSLFICTIFPLRLMFPFWSSQWANTMSYCYTTSTTTTDYSHSSIAINWKLSKAAVVSANLALLGERQCERQCEQTEGESSKLTMD